MTSGIQWKLPRTGDARIDAVMQDLLNRLRRFDVAVYDNFDLYVRKADQTSALETPIEATFAVVTPAATYTP